MNYLKSITTSVLASTGVTFPFSIGERIPGLEAGSSIWELREGVKRDDGTLLTLFIFDATLPPLQPGNKDRRTLMQLAKNALKKLRTIRHPDVIRYIDSVETDTHVYIATERVRPLEGVLRDWPAASKGKGKEEWIGWGVRSISTAIAFLNSPPLSLHHSYLMPSTIFITPAMEWRLGGFDLLTTRDDSAGVLWGLGGVAPGDVGERSAPEVRKGGWQVLRDTDPAQSDIYLLAILLFSLYNPSSPLPSLAAQPTPSSSGAIPKALFPLWKRMLNPNPRTRLATTAFVSEATSTGFWANNALANLVEGLDGFELRSESEKLGLLRTIKDSAGTIPQPFLLYRVLPSLLHSLSLPTAPSASMLPLVLDLGKLVPPPDYTKLVLEPVVKLYASPDRGTRMALLDGLGDYADKMDNRMVQEKVWPHLITGFADTVPVIREATVKAVFPLASKLNDRTLNNDLLRLLAKMQTDTEPSIRTNTCILLGRLAPILGPNTKKKVLVPAFARSLKDPFVHARVAGLMAFMATVEIFDRDDLAGKVIPNMAFSMVDREKLVREQAFKAMNMFMQRLTNMVDDMPDTVLPPDNQQSSYGPITTTSNTNTANQAGLVNSATGAAGALAGWAISSLSKQLASNEAHSTLSASSGTNGLSNGTSQSSSSAPSWTSTAPSSAPATVPGFGSTKFPSTTSSSSRGPNGTTYNPSKPSTVSGTGTGGMKLSSKAKSSTNAHSSLAETLASEWDDGDAANAWGTDDLIDVNADEDDWAAFESAPVSEAVVPPPQSYYLAPTPSQPQSRPTSTSATTGQGTGKSGSSTSNRATNPPSINRPPALAPAITTNTSPVKSAPARSSFDGWDEGASGESDARALQVSAKTGAGASGDPPASSTTSLVGLSKEDKEKEMARRRDERKARIAAMKEQKKGKA